MGGFAVGSLKQWLEIMAISGLMHGSTLSMTRVFFTRSGLSSMSQGIPVLSENIFNVPDFTAVAIAAGTVVGLVQGEECFPNVGDIEEITPDQVTSVGDGLKAAFNEHAEKSDKLRSEVLDTYKKRMGTTEFAENAWMFSDFFPRLFSMNQHTITT